MAVFIYGLNSSGIIAAIRCALRGTDCIAMEPTGNIGGMWASGLGQTDRESGRLNVPGQSIRWGVLKDFCLEFGQRAGDPKGTENLLVTQDIVMTSFLARLNRYDERRMVVLTDVYDQPILDKDGKQQMVQRGKITWRVNAPLESVTTSRKGNVIKTVTCGGVTYSATNFIDATDEKDLAKKLNVSMKLGRESRALSGEMTAGNRKVIPMNRMGIDPVTGERMSGLECRPRQIPGDADIRTMAFNMRLLVTNHADRIPWADLDIPGHNPRDHDVDLQVALARSLKTIPGSINDSPLKPVGTIPQWDMNNGGGLQLGTNWIGKMFDWHNSTHFEREDFRDRYSLRTASLFKTICTDSEWLRLLPACVADTKKWGLIPGVFTFPAWASGQTVQLGTQKFKTPYIYEVTGVTDADGIYYDTYAPPDWKPSTVYVVGDKRTNGDYRYEVISVPTPPVTTPPTPATGTSAASGGPTGKEASVTDGTVTWKYIGLRVPTAPTGFRPAGNTTAPTTGPVGAGTGIPDGTRVVWRMFRPFIPGMSPHVYVRESLRIVGQVELDYDDNISPEQNIAEPITVYGYPHMDAHIVQRFVNEDGFITHEGNTLLKKTGDDVCAIAMPLGAVKPREGECRNLVVCRGTAGTRLGIVPTRIELSWGKIADSCAILCTVADSAGIHTHDVDYRSQLLPALNAAGALLSFPGAP